MATPIATEYSTDTILGMMNQYYAMLGGGMTYNYMASTTLNQKYNCYPAQNTNGTWQYIPKDTNGNAIIPTMQYFGVGIRGFYNITADDEISPLSQPYRPKATEKDLYKPIPIRCVPKDHDLTSTERANYRLRTEMTIDGQSYICYWLKKLEFDNALSIVQIDANGAETTFDINNTDSTDLSPVPTAPTTPDVITGKNKVVIAASVTCEILGEEILEAINVIYHGDLRRARISEWGIYSGGDARNTPIPGSTSDTYTEAMYVQLAAKRCTTGVDMSNSATVQKEILTIQNGNLLMFD